MLTSTQLIIGAVLIIALIIYLLFLLVRNNEKTNRLVSQNKDMQRLLLDNQHANNGLINRLDELEANIYTLHKMVDPIPNKLTQLEGGLRDQLAQDPQIKLYQKAATMARQGSSAEEISLECDLPVAEASVLVSLNK